MKNLVLACLCPFALMALPSGISIEQGQALSSIKGQKLTIENAPGSVLHWQQFDISKQEMVHFAQANAKSAVLNRVTGENASQLLGTLTSNGTVFLINPNGVYVGSNAQIQTAGFLASTADLSNENFTSGDHLHFANLGPGAIVNDGHISCPQGDVFLIAKNVSNHGNIFAEHAGLLSAQEVIISPRGEKVFVRLKMENGTIENTGSIQALTVDLQTTSAHQKAIRHTGKIEANSIKQENGRVFLVAKEGDVTVDGQINAPAATVHVLAKNIDLQDQTQVDLSGSEGGTILIGGDYKGENPDIFNADTLNVAEGATIKADGYESDGGKIILWGNERNHCFGHLSAQAFGETGDGGFIEISSPGDWYFKLGQANVLSKNGQMGTKLFDPVNISINTAGPTSPALGAGPTTYTPAVNAVILDSDLATSLMTGNVTINTSGGAAGVGQVEFDAGSTITWSAATTLTINADRNILVNAGVTVTNVDAGSVVFNANVGGTATGDFQGIEIFGAGTVIGTNSGDISLTATGGTSAAALVAQHGIFIYDDALVTTVSGNITLNGTNGPTRLADGVRMGATGPLPGFISSTGMGAVGAIEINGFSAFATTGSDGVDISFGSRISTVDANIIVNGSVLPSSVVGPTDQDFRDGIQFSFDNPVIESTGNGAITLNGTATTLNVANANNNVGFNSSSGTISSAIGDITINGTHNGFGGACDAISLDGTQIISTASANISLTGSTTSTGSNSHGVILVSSNARIESQGTGTITVSGTGASGGVSNCNGVFMQGGGSVITSVGGDIEIIGIGGGTGSSNRGISVISGAEVTSTGGANIAMDGTGGDGTSGTQGIFISGSGSTITSNAGLIDMMGVGGGSGTSADGVAIISDASVIGSGTASLRMSGTASATGTTNNNGVLIDGTTTTLNTASGDINLTGVGDGTGNNVGIQISSAADVSSTSGAVIMRGTGGDAGSGGSGIDITGTNTLVTAGTGSITLVGNGQGSGTDNQGIVIESGAALTSTGIATIALTGIGSVAGTSANEGILITDTGTNVTSINGQILLTGTPGGGTDPGIHITSEGAVVSTTGAQISLITPSGDVLIEALGNIDSQGLGVVTSNIARDLNIFGSFIGATPAYINLTNGAANLSVGRDVNVIGGLGVGSKAQIGNRGSVGSATASILINAGRDVNIFAQNSYGIVGHGDPAMMQALSGAITVNAIQDITVTGGSTFAQIGHINAMSGGSMLSGDISLNARNNINVTGGSAVAGYARIGPGGQAGATIFDPSTMLLIAGVDISMATNMGQAQIVNSNGPLTLVTDDLFPTSPGMGAGGFSINSLISATGQLRIYTVTPSQNNINDLINGTAFVTGPFGIDTGQETWLTYFPDGGYGGLPFNIYYKAGILNPGTTLEIFENIAANLVQLSDLLPILSPSNLGLNILFNYPAYHFSICQEDRCDDENPENCATSQSRRRRTECTPNFAPYGSFIFEDDLHWIGTSW